MNRYCLRLILGALPALLFCGIASAALPPLKNAGFEKWEGMQPKHWGGMQLVAGAMDCQVRREGKCSLRLQASQGAGKSFVQINQTISGAEVQGAMARLLGWIKVAGHTRANGLQRHSL